MADAVLLIVLGTSIWVFFDAKSIGIKSGLLGDGFLDMGVTGWVFSCVSLWLIAFPAYLVQRRNYIQAIQKKQQAKAQDNDYKECPFCAETIKQSAKICRYCGRDVLKEEKS